MKLPFIIGRVMFGGYFLYSGINHFLHKSDLSQYAGAKSVPVPDLVVCATGAALIAGGASILLGVKPKLGAAAIVGFLAGVSPVMHNFWSEEDPNQRQNDMINFTKNLALAGSALALAAVEEPWPVAVPIAQPSKLKKACRTAWRALAA
ncbi:MAG: DoxX family protein [Bryobacteraceae bacterium]